VPVRWTLGRTSGACASLWLYRRALEQVLLVIEPVKGPQSAGARSETCRTIAAPEAQKSSIGEYEDTDVMWAIDQRPAMRAADAAGRRWLNSCLDLSHSSGKNVFLCSPDGLSRQIPVRGFLWTRHGLLQESRGRRRRRRVRSCGC